MEQIKVTQRISTKYPAIQTESRSFWVANHYLRIVDVKIWERRINLMDGFYTLVESETFAEESIQKLEEEVDRILETRRRIEVVELMVVGIISFAPDIFGPEFVSWVYDTHSVISREANRTNVYTKFQKVIKVPK